MSKSQPTWVPIKTAAKARGCSRPVITRAALTGEVRTLVLPGPRVMVCLEDARKVEMIGPRARPVPAGA